MEFVNWSRTLMVPRPSRGGAGVFKDERNGIRESIQSTRPRSHKPSRSVLGRHSTASDRIRDTHGTDPFEHDDDLNLACSASHGDARAPLDRRLLRTERYAG